MRGSNRKRRRRGRRLGQTSGRNREGGRAITLRKPDLVRKTDDWIKENFDEIYDLAQSGYQKWGRGVIWIDLTKKPPQAKYIDQREATKRFAGPPGTQLVAEYDPEREMVVAAYKGHWTYDLVRLTLVQDSEEQEPMA